MSSASNMASTASDFETLLNAALDKYTKQTGTDLRSHPLADKIDNCDGPDSILDIFQEQAQAFVEFRAQAFVEFRNGDTKLLKWLRPVVNVLHALSTNSVLSDIGILVSAAMFHIIHSRTRTFDSSGVSSLNGDFFRHWDSSICAYLPRYFCPTYIRDYQVAKYVRASYDALVDIFECIENFLRRLKIYTDISLPRAMTEMVVKIMVELLSVLALATKQINQGRFSMSVVDSIYS